MTAPTVSVRLVYAHTTTRNGRLHYCSQRDSGALNPICGANPIRGRAVAQYDAPPVDVALCDDCRDLGVAATHGLAEVRLEALETRPDARTADEGLTESIRQHGILVPIIVTPDMTVIAGARRVHAARAAGLDTIPAIVRTLDPGETLIASLVENLHRADLNPIEQAHAYQEALTVLDCSKAELGRRLGISREQISNTIRLLTLSAEDQACIAAGELTASDGRARLAKTTRPPRLGDLSAILTAHFGTRVLATAKTITITIPDGDPTTLLEQLGIRQEDAA